MDVESRALRRVRIGAHVLTARLDLERHPVAVQQLRKMRFLRLAGLPRILR